MEGITSLAGKSIKRHAAVIAKAFNRVILLDKKNTHLKLAKGQLFYEEGEVQLLPSVKSWGGASEYLRNSMKVNSSAASVFLYKAENDEVRILNYGGIKINNEVLDLDFGNAPYIKTLLKKDKRPTINVENCIPLWSHEWGGYYDFLLFIFAKLLRTKSVIGESEFQKCVIVYPLIERPFEKELLRHLGISVKQILDSRKFNVKARTYYLGNNENFFYQPKTDIQLLRDALNIQNDTTSHKSKLIYISRSGRRKIVNEQDVIEILKAYGFDIIQDVPRSVAEQKEIYKEAKIIIGPHGASFTNILWCKGGTVLVELFSGSYCPPYFRYLANILDLNYYAILESKAKKSDHKYLNEDIFVDLKTFKEALAYIIKKHVNNF